MHINTSGSFTDTGQYISLPHYAENSVNIENRREALMLMRELIEIYKSYATGELSRDLGIVGAEDQENVYADEALSSVQRLTSILNNPLYAGPVTLLPRGMPTKEEVEQSVLIPGDDIRNPAYRPSIAGAVLAMAAASVIGQQTKHCV